MMLLYSKDLTLFMCHFSLTFLHRVFLNVSPNCLPEKRHSHIGCICLIFLHCAFSNGSSKHFRKRTQSYIGCICLAFPHCVSANVFPNGAPKRFYSHIGCIWNIFVFYLLFLYYLYWQSIHFHHYLQYSDPTPFLASAVPWVVLLSNWWEGLKIANLVDWQMKVKFFVSPFWTRVFWVSFDSEGPNLPPITNNRRY